MMKFRRTIAMSLSTLLLCGISATGVDASGAGTAKNTDTSDCCTEKSVGESSISYDSDQEPDYYELNDEEGLPCGEFNLELSGMSSVELNESSSDDSDYATDGDASELFIEEEKPLISDSPSNECSYKVTDTIAANFKDGILTFEGSGDIPDYEYTKDEYYNYYADTPWKDIRLEVTDVVMSDEITGIGSYAFVGLENCSFIDLSSNLKTIGDAAFYEMKSLEKLDIPSGVTVIPQAMLCYCSSLEKVTMGNVTTVGDYAFSNTSIKEFNVPKSLTEISTLAFFDNPKLLAFNVASDNPSYKSVDGILFSKDGTKLIRYPQNKAGTTYNCSGVISIAQCAFRNTPVETVNLNGVKTLESSAFQEANITSVVIPDSVTEVDYFTFYKCPNLKSVTFGNGFTKTSYQMFRDCSALETVNFGSTLTELDAHTFAYCTSLKTVMLPSNIKTIGVGCFGCCSNLESFTSSSVEEIPFQCFLNCYALKNLSINNVKRLFRQSIVCNQGLGCNDFTLPATVEFVSEYAFNDNAKVTCLNPKIKPYGFNGFRIQSAVNVTGENKYDLAYQVLALVNQKRAAAGVPALVMDSNLLNLSMERAAELTALFSHTRPDGSYFNAHYRKAYGENIAVGSSTAAAVMDQWMNSTGHKENILDPNYTNIGIGCFYYNDQYYWVQDFGLETGDNTAKPQNVKKTVKIYLAMDEFGEASAPGEGVVFSFGDNKTYKYKGELGFDNNYVHEGSKIKATFGFINPGWEYTYCLPDPYCLSWDSSKKNIATVNTSGMITAVAEGNTDIRATVNEGDLTASKAFTVGVNPETGKYGDSDSGDGMVPSGSRNTWIKKDGFWFYIDESGQYAKNEWRGGYWLDADGKCTYDGVGSWKCNSTGWWYEDTNGWYPYDQWQKIDGKWYFFDSSGYMCADEWRDGYWLDSNGAWTYEGIGTWRLSSGGWWFGDTSGWYACGQWQKINGSWYYFDTHGYWAG